MITTKSTGDPALHRLVGGQRVGVGDAALELAVNLLELLDALLFYGWVAQRAALARLDDARDGAVREARGLVHEDLGGRGDDWGHGCCVFSQLSAVGLDLCSGGVRGERRVSAAVVLAGGLLGTRDNAALRI